MPDFLDDLSGVLGGKRGQVTSTYRTQAEQDALRASGATTTKHSIHTDGNAFDYVPNKGQTAGDVTDQLTQAGYGGVHVLDETAPGQGTGPHYHVSAKMNGAFLPGSTPSLPTRPTVNQVAASTGGAPAANVTSPGDDPLNPFANAPEVKELTTQRDDATAAAGNVITSTDAALKANSDDHAAVLADNVAKRNAIVAGNDSAVQELADGVKPIFARKAAIGARLVELQDMSPIKRAFMGLFHRDYNEGHLNALDGALSGEAKDLGEQYTNTTETNRQLIQDIDQRQQGSDSLSALKESSLNLDKSIASDTVQVAQQRLSNAIMGIQVGQQLTAAQIQSREDTLSKMTPQQVNTAMAQAKAAGGTAMINGTPLSLEELTHRGQQYQEQDIQLKSAKLGLAAQEQGVQEHAENQLIAHMSSGDLQSAIAADGMYHGHRLNQEQLTQAYGAMNARTSGQVQESMTNIGGQTYTQGIDRLNASTQESMRRITGVTGAQLPAPYLSQVNGMVAQSQAWQQKIDAAPNEAVKQQIRAQALQALGGMAAKTGEVVDHIAQNMTRNKDTQVLLGGWMKGIPVTGEATTKGLIGLFQGGNGLPKGIKLSGPTAQMYAAAKTAYDGVITANGGAMSTQDIMAGKGKISKDEFNRQIMTAVTQAGSNAWNNAQYQQLQTQLPAMAKQAGHPAGNIRPADLSGATVAGDAAAKTAMAQRLGISEDQVNAIFGQGGTKGAGYAALQAKGGKASGSSWSQASGQYQLDTNMNMMRALDASPSARPGFVPSHALADFMNSPTYGSQLNRVSGMLPHQDFGSFMGDGISNGSIASLMGAHGQALHQSMGAIANADQQQVRSQVQMYQNDPLKRTATILAAIPGLDQHSQTLLMSQLRDTLPTGSMGSGGEVGASVSGAIDHIMTQGRFQDPKLERIRAQAAKHWNDYSSSTDNAVMKLLKSAF